MKISINRSARLIRLGTRSYPLYDDKRRIHDFVCETKPGVAPLPFSRIHNLRGLDLPDRVLFATDRPTPRHRLQGEAPLVSVDVIRHRKQVRLEVEGFYSFDLWAESIDLKEFFARFVRLISRSRTLSIKVLVGDDPSELWFRVSEDFPLDTPLVSLHTKIEKQLRSNHIQALNELQSELFTAAVVRGRLNGDYARRRRRAKPVAFICHDSRDKVRAARPIAMALAALKCPVWYDEFSLSVGDHLRESIEKGLREARSCILILSPRFLANRGWTRTEFNSVFSRELVEKKQILMPVWMGVTREQVLRYSPSLANRVAADWKHGLYDVVSKLYAALRR